MRKGKVNERESEQEKRRRKAGFRWLNHHFVATFN